MTPYIVICDDESHIVLALTMKLSRAGYRVESAGDGRTAWELIQRNPPDLVITDCQMPRMNGIDLCRHIRENPFTSEVPVLMLTAKGFELDADELRREFGISKIILKPFSPRELLETVQALLENVSVPVA